ncbi:hypothetical protein PPUJ13061_50490 [Pseudomonas putida]|mgnify:FL=1|nr:hypothetical protein PPUJ13061_50490 [Pseudomonas putida]
MCRAGLRKAAPARAVIRSANVTARRVCRRAADSVILAGFSPNSYESRAPMEIQPILNTIKDLTERSQSIRGYL